MSLEYSTYHLSNIQYELENISFSLYMQIDLQSNLGSYILELL